MYAIRSYYATPVFDEDGELIRVVVSERDVTEIDKLQRELEEQEAIKDQFRHQMLEMQQTELEARRIIARSPSMIRALQQAIKVSKAESVITSYSIHYTKLYESWPCQGSCRPWKRAWRQETRIGTPTS